MLTPNPEERLDQCALVVVDVQVGFDDPRWGRRNNPACEQNVALLIDEWRRHERPVIFVRHDSPEPNSPLAPGSPGNQFKEPIDGDPDLLVAKHVNSAFYGQPDLDGWLRERHLRTVVICGITTDHCCSTTARMADNLGYDVLFVSDATHTSIAPRLTAHPSPPKSCSGRPRPASTASSQPSSKRATSFRLAKAQTIDDVRRSLGPSPVALHRRFRVVLNRAPDLARALG